MLADLRDGPIQFAIARVRQFTRIIQDHFAAITVLGRVTLLLERREQISLGLSALNIVIRHYRMYYIVGPPLGHVTADAVLGLRMSARGRQFPHRRVVALPAHRRIMPRRLFSPRDIVRIVTSGAIQRPRALLETSRAPQPVRGANDLEFVVVPSPRRVVELKDVVA